MVQNIYQNGFGIVSFPYKMEKFLKSFRIFICESIPQNAFIRIHRFGFGLFCDQW